MKKILKNKLCIFGILFMFAFPILAAGNTFAYCDGDGVLGLKPWCHNMVDPNEITSDEELTNNIWQIAVNVADDITIASGYLLLCFIILGGYKYMLANGDIGKVQSGKNTLARAAIGFAIVAFSRIIFTTIRFLVASNAATVTTDGGLSIPDANPTIVVTDLIQWFITIAGIVSVVFILIGGFSYMTSSGDAGKITKAKNVILYSLIGLGIVVLSQIIVGFIASTIDNASSTSYNQTIIEKEFNEKEIC